MNLEFVDESTEGADTPGDDVLDAGATRRAPRWLIGVLCAAAGVAAVAVVVRRQEPAAPVAAPTTAVVAPVLPGPLAALDETFADVYLRANDPARAEDIVRSGSDTPTCMGVRVGTVPQHDASAALVRELPGYAVLDTARIIDRNAGLCALQVRARSSAGTVTLIMVSSRSSERTPPRPRAIVDRQTVVDGVAVQYARLRTADGWIVVVGSSGPRADAPPLAALTQLAGSPALRW